MNKSQYQNHMETIKKQKREIWDNAFEEGHREAMNEVLSFVMWFDHEKNVDLYEIIWFLEARLKPRVNTAGKLHSVQQLDS